MIMDDVAAIIDALPSTATGGDLDSDKLRTALVQGVVGIIPADTSIVAGVLQLDPTDAELGGVRQAYVYGTDAGVFVLDPLDETTAQDLIYCLVLIGGKRYKRAGKPAIGTVISRSVTTPPDPANSPPGERNYGDAYLNLGGGGWAAEGIAVNSIAVWSSLGGGAWQEVEPAFGPPLYVQDEDGFVHWAGTAGWVDGVGSNAYQDASIPPSAFIWDDRVANQTLTELPTSWSKGDAWIVGAGAGGVLAGQDTKIALALADGVAANGDTLTIIAPKVGKKVYDEALVNDYRWNGAGWEKASGNYKLKTTTILASQNFTKDARCFGLEVYAIGPGGSGCNSSATTNPGDTTFGAYQTAKGGKSGGVTTGAHGAGGSGSAADWSRGGTSGSGSGPGESTGPFGSLSNPMDNYGRGAVGSVSNGGGGEATYKWHRAADITDTVVVTIGARSGSGVWGQPGWVMIREHINE